MTFISSVGRKNSILREWADVGAEIKGMSVGATRRDTQQGANVT